MASKKVTITLPEELLEELALAAQTSGISVSRLIATATEQDLRRRAGLQAMVEWQHEHGPFTPEELAEARAEAAAADADLIAAMGPGPDRTASERSAPSRRPAVRPDADQADTEGRGVA